ncbi:hypothetical protein NYO67_12280 [Aspergillus flavus]|nr:hypothetical protein NYO67_12280 [Aspergillus flavus]
MSPSGVIFPPTANNLPAENLRTQYMGYTNNFNMFPIQYYHPANIFVARIVSQRLDLSAQSVYLPNGTLFADMPQKKYAFINYIFQTDLTNLIGLQVLGCSDTLCPNVFSIKKLS